MYRRAIMDANVVGEAFGGKSSAGKRFCNWISQCEEGCLVIGGKLKEEIRKVERPEVKEWFKQVTLAERSTNIEDSKVNKKAKEIEKLCKSNDPHIIALAQLGNARFLYSNDKTLHEDFKNLKLLKKPPGKVYSSTTSKSFRFP